MATDPDLAGLLASWEVHLRAQRKSEETVKLYVGGVRHYLAWCEKRSEARTFSRALVTAFVADLLDQGKEAATARAYQLSVRRYSAWLAEEDLLDHDPLVGLKPPKLDIKVVPVLTSDQLKALVRACDGKAFRDRRDEALIRLLAETGIRAGEAVALHLDDVDLGRGLVVVRRGKGGKGRLVPFGPQTGRSLDRYLRVRRTHPRASEGLLWVGERGQGFTYAALARALKRRARAAGVPDFHVHVLRHTYAARWLAAGGSEGGLMAVAGWSRREMLDRYVVAVRSELAAQEARGLDLGDL